MMNSILATASLVVPMSALLTVIYWRHRSASLDMVDVHDRVAGLQRELLRSAKDYSRVLAAVAHHRNMRGYVPDAINDNELYVACGLEPARQGLPPLCESLAQAAGRQFAAGTDPDMDLASLSDTFDDRTHVKGVSRESCNCYRDAEAVATVTSGESRE